MYNVHMDETGKNQEYLSVGLHSQKIKGLCIQKIEAVPSKEDLFIQIADLFTAPVNRKLHSTTNTRIKDEFADFVLNSLNFDINKINLQNNDIDNSALFNLSEFNRT